MSEADLMAQGFRPLYRKQTGKDERGVDAVMVLEKLDSKRTKRKAATLYVSAHIAKTNSWARPVPFV